MTAAFIVFSLLSSSVPFQESTEPPKLRGRLVPGTDRATQRWSDGSALGREMDTRIEIRDFLTSRRARITPWSLQIQKVPLGRHDGRAQAGVDQRVDTATWIVYPPR
jgi:hypothetical protein